MDVWEELDDYPKVVSVVFSYVKAVSSDCLRLIGVWFRVSKRRVFSSMISFSVERERECYKSKSRFSSSCFGKIMFRFTYLWWGC